MAQRSFDVGQRPLQVSRVLITVVNLTQVEVENSDSCRYRHQTFNYFMVLN